MQIDVKKIISDIRCADSISTILKSVQNLEQTISAGEDVDMSIKDLQEIRKAARARCNELQAVCDEQLRQINRRHGFLRQATTLDPELVTVEMLQELDGVLLWVSDDYLSKRNMQGGDRLKLAQFLDRVAEVKAKARADGVVFSA